MVSYTRKLPPYSTVRGTRALVSFAPLAFNLLRVQHTPYDGAVPAAAAAQRTAAVATLRIAAVHRVWSLPRWQAKWRHLRDAGFRASARRPRSPTIMSAAGRMCYMTILARQAWGRTRYLLSILFGEQRDQPAASERLPPALVGSSRAWRRESESAPPRRFQKLRFSTPSTRREQ